MNRAAKIMAVILCMITVPIIMSITYTLNAVAAQGTNSGVIVKSGGSIANPSNASQTYSVGGESPELAINGNWTVLNFGEGNIKQVTITVETHGYIDVFAYLEGDKTEHKLVLDDDVLTFQCYRIDLQNGFPYEYDNKRIVYYNCVITELNSSK